VCAQGKWHWERVFSRYFGLTLVVIITLKHLFHLSSGAGTATHYSGRTTRDCVTPNSRTERKNVTVSGRPDSLVCRRRTYFYTEHKLGAVGGRGERYLHDVISQMNKFVICPIYTQHLTSFSPYKLYETI
jgi:hypothetical protein